MALEAHEGNFSVRRIGRPPLVDGRQTRALLLVVARTQFAGVGYSKATNASIAAAAGVTAATIHHYFGGKRNLYAAVAHDCSRLVLEHLVAQADSEAGFVENLKRAVVGTAAMNTRHPYLAEFAVQVEAESFRHPELRDVAEEFQRTLHSFYDPLIASSFASGTIRSDIDEDALRNVIAVVRDAAARLAVRTGPESARFRAAIVAIEALIEGTLLNPSPAGVGA